MSKPQTRRFVAIAGIKMSHDHSLPGQLQVRRMGRKDGRRKNASVRLLRCRVQPRPRLRWVTPNPWSLSMPSLLESWRYVNVMVAERQASIMTFLPSLFIGLPLSHSPRFRKPPRFCELHSRGAPQPLRLSSRMSSGPQFKEVRRDVQCSGMSN